MKKLLPLAFLIFFFYSCIESSEDFSSQTLEGSWLRKFENTYEALDIVYSFDRNGTYENFIIRTGSQEDLENGIVGYYKGNYSISEGTILFSDRRYFYPEVYENPPSVPEELIEQTSFPMVIQSAEISFEENEMVMVLVYGCNDMIPQADFMSICLEPEPKRYDRIVE